MGFIILIASLFFLSDPFQFWVLVGLAYVVDNLDKIIKELKKESRDGTD